MTDKEKLQKLFDAALRDPEPATGNTPHRAFPANQAQHAAVPVTPPLLKPAPVVAHESVLPDTALAARMQNPIAETSTPKAPVLDDAASDELGALLDEQITRQARKRRRDSLVAALVLFGLTGGGFGWFVQSPDRVEAFKSAMTEIRSVTDVKGMIAKYQAALDKISARSQQIDQATAAMGIDPTTVDDKDPNMEAEMKQMMGGEGKTVGERNRALQQAFGNRAKAAGGTHKIAAVISKDDSFDFTN